jgi:hypothetical protein
MSAQGPKKARNLNLQVLKGRLSVCRLAANIAIPDWAIGGGEFVSITRTSDELSVVCSESSAPKDVKCEHGWRAFKVAGPLDFSLTGITESIAKPLAEAGVSIFAVSTYDTDYVMVKEENLEKAIRALSAAGHVVKVD